MIIETELSTVLGSLTAKQRDLVELLGEGLTSKEIARNLGVSPSAIEQRLKILKEKFGVATKSELSRRCRQSGAPVLSASEQSIIAEGLSSRDVNLLGRHAEFPTATGQTKPHSIERSLGSQINPAHHARFLLGFVLGFLSGSVVAGATATFAFRTILEVVS